jgi:hypothetical protein
MSGEIAWFQAAEIIGISCRQMRRWKRRWEQHGYEGLLDHAAVSLHRNGSRCRYYRKCCGCIASSILISTCDTRNWWARAFAVVKQTPNAVCRLHCGIRRPSTSASAPRIARIRHPLDPRKQQTRQNLGQYLSVVLAPGHLQPQSS